MASEFACESRHYVEKLFLTDRLKDFDNAVFENRQERAFALLVEAGIDSEEAQSITLNIFANPKKYGYCPGGCLATETAALR